MNMSTEKPNPQKTKTVQKADWVSKTDALCGTTTVVNIAAAHCQISALNQ